jgi:hypothetical protein
MQFVDGSEYGIVTGSIVMNQLGGRLDGEVLEQGEGGGGRE